MTLPTRRRAFLTKTGPARQRVLTDPRLRDDDRFPLIAVVRAVSANA